MLVIRSSTIPQNDIPLVSGEVLCSSKFHLAIRVQCAFEHLVDRRAVRFDIGVLRHLDRRTGLNTARVTAFRGCTVQIDSPESRVWMDVETADALSMDRQGIQTSDRHRHISLAFWNGGGSDVQKIPICPETVQVVEKLEFEVRQAKLAMKTKEDAKRDMSVIDQ